MEDAIPAAAHPIMIRRARSWIGNPRGQALIEFAFIAPLMFIILFTIVDFGIALDRRITLQHAVREGARYAAVHTIEGDIISTTEDQSQGLLDTAVNPNAVTVCYEDSNGDLTLGNAGDAVRVAGEFTWEFPILSEMFDAIGIGSLSIDMTPSGTARLEQTVGGATACT